MMLSALRGLPHVILQKSYRVGVIMTHFTDEETEGQKG